MRLNWMSAFLKQPWSNARSMLCAILENFETFEKLHSMIWSCYSIYNHFLKPIKWNIHKLWHQASIVMKITLENFKKIVKSPHFLHLTSAQKVKTQKMISYVKVMCKWAFSHNYCWLNWILLFLTNCKGWASF